MPVLPISSEASGHLDAIIPRPVVEALLWSPAWIENRPT
jgi:hypothetical protein